MKKTIYIIPGLGENCNLIRYKMLSEALKNKGYEVIPVNPNWYRPLSEQVFSVRKNSIIFGFSFGAIIAYLIAKKYQCKKVIFASISPIHEFSYNSLVKDYCKYMSKDLAIEIATDIKKIKISFKNLKAPFTTLAGQFEKMKADILIPKTRHRITPTYIKYVCDLL